MYIKIGSFEFATGKDARPREAVPQAPTEELLDKSTRTMNVLSERVNNDPNFFGVELMPGPPLKTLSRDLDVPQVKSSNALALLTGKPHQLTAAIEWPEIDGTPMEQTELSILINRSDHWFKEYRSIDIQPLDAYIHSAGLMLVGDAKAAYDVLRKLHCVKFDKIHPEVLRTLPELYSTILAGSSFSLDIRNYGAFK